MDESQKKYRASDKFRKLCKRYRDKLRRKVMALLGGICVTCKENVYEFLALDHFNNDGFKEKGNKTVVLRRATKQPFEFQILCHNCNWQKYVESKQNEIKKILNSETKKCSSCLLLKSTSEFNKSKDRKGLFNYCKKCMVFYAYIKKIKIIDLMGGKCSCCNNNTPVHLNVDHINNDGNKKRPEGCGTNLYTRLINKKISFEGLQLLCCNCNISKHLGKGTCFHQRNEL